MTTANTAEIHPTLLRIWEKERTMNPGPGGTDRHVAWCHGTIIKMALMLDDQEKKNLMNLLETQLETLSKNTA